MSRHIKTTHPIAIKEHKCYLCGLKIPKGEKYTRTTHEEDRIGSLPWKRTIVSEGFHDKCLEYTKNWDIMDWEIGVDCVEFRQTYLKI